MADGNSDLRYTFQALAGFFIGNLAIFSLPLYVGGLMDGLSTNENQAGLICSLEIGALAVTCVLFSGWLDRIPLRIVGIAGVCLALIGNLLSFSQVQLGYLSLFRILCGMGSGMCLAASSAVISRASDPDRVTGVVVAINTVLMTIVIMAMGYAKQSFLFDGVAGIFLLALLLAFAPMLMLPGATTDIKTRSPGEEQINEKNIFLFGLFGVGLLFIFCLVEGSIWSFSERAGVSLGVPEVRIGKLLAASQLSGLLGAAVSVVSGNRISREIPLITGSILMGVSGYLVYNTGQQLIYELSIPSFTFGFFMAFPYLIGGCARLDREGRWAARAMGINLMGAAMAPIVAGNIIAVSGYRELGQFIIVLSITCCLGGLIFASGLQRFSLQAEKPTSAY